MHGYAHARTHTHAHTRTHTHRHTHEIFDYLLSVSFNNLLWFGGISLKSVSISDHCILKVTHTHTHTHEISDHYILKVLHTHACTCAQNKITWT